MIDYTKHTPRHSTVEMRNITGQWQARCTNRRCVWVSLPYPFRDAAAAAGEQHRTEGMPRVNLRKPVSLVKRPRAGERVNYVKAGA